MQSETRSALKGGAVSTAQRKRREDEAKAVGGDALGMQISMSDGQPDTLWVMGTPDKPHNTPVVR